MGEGRFPGLRDRVGVDVPVGLGGRGGGGADTVNRLMRRVLRLPGR